MSVARGRSLTRLLSIVEALRAARRGLTIRQLVERTDGSRASIYRDLNVLRAAGLPVDKLQSAGEMRYVLAGSTGTYALTPLQLAALVAGRRSLSPLEGTRLVRELDVFLRQVRAQPQAAGHVHLPLAHTFAPDRMTIIDRALDQNRCVRIRYRGTRDAAASWRLVEPVELRVSALQPYLVAYDRDGGRFKSYKLVRISQVQMLTEPARSRARYDGNKEFAHSRGIWSGPTHEVVVRVHKAVARFVREWPLHRDQRVDDTPAGDVIVHARVAGLEESLRWVLSWGKLAEVLQPAELRQRLADELESAVALYRPKRRRAERGVSSLETR